MTHAAPGAPVNQIEPVRTPFGIIEYKFVVMVLYILSLFMQIMDGTALNVAIPSLARQFGVAATDVDWAVIGYLIGLASLLPAGGWLANRFGSRKVFLIALGLFVFASLLCGLANSLEQLIAFRVLQGAGSGVMTPIGSALLISAFPLAERARATTIIVGVVVIAPAVGPVLGGFLVEFLNWRWIFFINLPIGAIALSIGLLWLRSMPQRPSGSLDVLGLVLASAGMTGVLFGISEGPSRGFGSPLILGALMIGAALLAGLVMWELKPDSSLLDLSLFRERLFRVCNLMAFPAYMAFMGLIFVMPILLQSLLGYSALKTGLVMMPQPLGVLIMSQVAGRVLYARIGPRRLFMVGLFGGFVFTALMSLVDLETGALTISAVMLGRGLCMALLFVPLQTAVYAKTEIPDMPNATTLFSIVRQAAPAFGVALAATWITARGPRTTVDVALSAAEKLERLGPMQESLLISGVPFLVAMVIAWFIHDEDAAETMVRR